MPELTSLLNNQAVVAIKGGGTFVHLSGKIVHNGNMMYFSWDFSSV